MDERILELSRQGLSIREISERVGLSKTSVHERISGYSKSKVGVIKTKLKKFETGYKSNKVDRTVPLDREKAMKKILSTRDCYLSGRPIDITNRKQWSLDHKNPKSRGGTNSINNMGVSSSIVNRSKQDMNVQEFIEMCVDVARHNGYIVYKKQG